MPDAPTASAARTPEGVLKSVFGYETFRPHQRDVISQILSGEDTLAVMPTGAGKSICYQIPALVFGRVTFVISPLISLMKDQVEALRQAGVQAAFVNSTLSAPEMDEVLRAAEAGLVKLLYIAPERLETPSFLAFARRCPPSFVAVDEAHCISQWGQDFRPSYLKIREFVELLPVRPPVAAFTATATERVREDIIEKLGLRNVTPHVTSFDRPNLHFAVKQVRGARDKARVALRMCRQVPGRNGIIYCMTRKTVEEVCDSLRAHGVSAAPYHAGLSAAARHKAQDDFLYGRVDVIVATTAFGMGIDKSDVGFVLHYQLPLDIESYYQEAGRAGRDGEPAECLLLYQASDAHLCEFLIERSVESAVGIDDQTRGLLLDRGLIRLRTMQSYCTTHSCLRAYLLRYFGETPPLRCDNCSRCETDYEEEDATVEAQKILSCVWRLRERGRTVGRSTVVDILRGSKSRKMTDQRYDSLSTYGIMEDCPRDRALLILDELVQRGLLTASTDKYRTLSFNSASMRFLREHEQFFIEVPKSMPKTDVSTAGTAVSGGRKRAGARTEMASGDEGLFDSLRVLRSSIALEQGAPAYTVFSNRTLREMASVRPHTPEEFLEISGVGEVKCERYADEFLAAIAAYEAEEGQQL